jgi:hypothetical protein
MIYRTDKAWGFEFTVDDCARFCMTGGNEVPDGVLWGCDADGTIDGCFDAGDEIIIGAIDAPDFIPAGAWEHYDNALLAGAFAKIVRRPA